MQQFDTVPQSWYPISLSTQVKNGDMLPLIFFGEALILFRNEKGVPALIPRFCPHMGTDLANGTVANGCIVCPLHRWRISANGTCVDAPTMFKHAVFSVKERYGIVFAFYGPEPLFDIPDFTELSEPAYVAPHVVVIDNCYLAVTLNGFDASHFNIVHHRDLTDLRMDNVLDKSHFGYSITMHVNLERWNDYLMKYLGYSTSLFRLDCWGGNLLMSRNRSTKHTAFLAMMPSADGEKTTLYFLSAEQKKHGLLGVVMQKIKLPLVQYLAFTFIKSDVPVIKNMRPRKGQLIPGKDDLVLHFWNYWDNLPRGSASDHV